MPCGNRVKSRSTVPVSDEPSQRDDKNHAATLNRRPAKKVDCRFEGISVHCKIGRKVVGAVIFGLVIVALPMAIAKAAGSNSETPSNAAAEQFEEDSDSLPSRFTSAPVEPQVPQVR